MPPPVGSWYLNIDASFIKSRDTTGVAGVMRDVNGEWMVGFGKICLVTSPLMVELNAIYEGLKLIKENDWHSVTILSDCLVAVNCINAPHVLKDETFNLVSSSRLLLGEMNDVHVQRTRRQANKVADKLAKFCRKTFLDFSDAVIFNSPMEDVILLYEEDKPP